LVIIDQLQAALKQGLDAYNQIGKKFEFIKNKNMSPDISSGSDCLVILSYQGDSSLFLWLLR
jgi:hypothetical protein